MNKKAIYKFLKKINTAKSNKALAEIINQGFIDITGALACWTGLINWGTNQIEVKKIKETEKLKANKNLVSEVKKIRQIAFDYYKDFEMEDLNEYLELTSKKNIILKPLIYRNNSLGYIGMISDDENFNKKNIEIVNILLEYIYSRLEIMSLYEERKRSGRERIEFLASIAHEFKTPLNSIMGFSDLLAEKFQKTDNEKYLNNISKSSAYLMRLIQNILDYTKNEYGTIDLKPEKIRAKEIIDDIILSFDEIRKEKNITFNYTLSDITIKADLIRFKQLVYNLISNAIKFSKENSSISIVTFLNNKKEFTFEIQDKGDGISKRDLAKIFNFFTQVNRSELKRKQGSGVGLAICKKIARSHGGDLYVKSKLHQGSTFWFTIPQKKSSR